MMISTRSLAKHHANTMGSHGMNCESFNKYGWIIALIDADSVCLNEAIQSLS